MQNGWLLVLVTLLATSGTINLDLLDPYLLTTDQPGSQFGYKVTLHQNEEGNYILVSAPLANTTTVMSSGAVYVCSVINQTCTSQIEALVAEGNKYVSPDDPRAFLGSSYTETDKYSIQSEEISGQWMGASLHSAPDNQYVVACAHRRETRFLDLGFEDPPRQLTGGCQLLDSSLTSLDLHYQPCIDQESGYERWGMCQAGSSAVLFGEELIIGAPGCDRGTGRLIRYEAGSYFLDSEASKTYDDETESSAYIGYTTVVCDMNLDGEMEIISGGPRANRYRGQVYMYRRSSESLKLVPSEQLPFSLEGEQMGSYYGSALLCTDITGDGTADLIVGAPLYGVYPEGAGQIQPDTGRVYVYPGREGSNFLPDNYDSSQLVQILTGASPGEGFGFSLATAGDIDGDGVGDVIVGSPYHSDQQGKITLYLGSKDGLQLAQVITPLSLGLDGLSSFGQSLAGGKDMDGNGYPDVAVGAKDSALLLRSLPLIDVRASVSSLDGDRDFDPQGSPSIKGADGKTRVGVKLQVCFEMVSDVSEGYLIHFNLHIDSAQNSTHARLFTRTPNNTVSQMHNGTVWLAGTGARNCSAEIEAYSRGSTGFSLSPILFTLSAHINPAPVFSSRKALNQALISSSGLELPVASDCPSDTRLCLTRVGVAFGEPRFRGQDKHPLAYGVTEKVTLPITATNYGPDTAYGASLYLTIPHSLPFLGPSKCSVTDQSSTDDEMYVLTCPLHTTRLTHGSREITEVILDMRGITAATELQLTVNVSVSDPSKLIYESDTVNLTSFTLEVENLVDVVIQGGSSQSRVAYNKKYGVSNRVLGYTGPSFRHMVEVSLSESSYNRFAENVVLQVRWPARDSLGRAVLPLVKLDKTVIAGVRVENATDDVCNYTLAGDLSVWPDFNPEKLPSLTRLSCEEDSEGCDLIQCKVPLLERGGATFKLTLHTQLQEQYLYDQGTVQVVTVGEVISAADGVLPFLRTAQVTTVLYPSSRRSFNLMWIIIGSIIGGLLLLLIILLCLWRGGFFTRLKPEPYPHMTVGYLELVEETPLEI